MCRPSNAHVLWHLAEVDLFIVTVRELNMRRKYKFSTSDEEEEEGGWLLCDMRCKSKRISSNSLVQKKAFFFFKLNLVYKMSEQIIKNAHRYIPEHSYIDFYITYIIEIFYFLHNLFESIIINIVSALDGSQTHMIYY